MANTIIVKPAGTTLTAEVPHVDLSTAQISETLGKVRVEPGATLTPEALDRVETLRLILPADSFPPFKITFPSAAEDEIFALLRELNTLNEMIGGNGIDIETVSDDKDAR